MWCDRRVAAASDAALSEAKARLRNGILWRLPMPSAPDGGESVAAAATEAGAGAQKAGGAATAERLSISPSGKAARDLFVSGARTSPHVLLRQLSRMRGEANEWRFRYIWLDAASPDCDPSAPGGGKGSRWRFIPHVVQSHVTAEMRLDCAQAACNDAASRTLSALRAAAAAEAALMRARVIAGCDERCGGDGVGDEFPSIENRRRRDKRVYAAAVCVRRWVELKAEVQAAARSLARSSRRLEQERAAAAARLQAVLDGVPWGFPESLEALSLVGICGSADSEDLAPSSSDSADGEDDHMRGNPAVRHALRREAVKEEARFLCR